MIWTISYASSSWNQYKVLESSNFYQITIFITNKNWNKDIQRCHISESLLCWLWVFQHIEMWLSRPSIKNRIILFQNLTASFVVHQFLPSPSCNFHREWSNEELASTCKTKESIKINDPEFISKNNSLGMREKKRFWNLKSVMQEQIASWILCANGCVNEIIIKTVIFNKTTNILFNIFVNWKTCYICQKGFFISGSIISVAEWLPDRGTIWST